MNKYYKLALIALLIASNGFSQNLDSGLVGCYPFSSNALDLSGNRHNGIVSGAQLTADRFNNPNSAYYFNGTSDCIAINNFDSLAPQDELSISFWERADAQTSNCPFILSPDNESDRLVLGTKYEGNIYFDYGNILTTGRASAPDPYNTLWNHYVFIVSAKNHIKQVYRNDSLVISTPLVDHLINRARTLLIGGGSDANNGNIRFHGAIDDVRIYSRTLTSSEVAALFNLNSANCSPLPTVKNCLVTCMPLNGNALDLSGFNHNGSVNGAVATSDRNGNPNGAMHFNGTSDYIAINNFDSIVTGQEFAISCWAQADEETSNSLFMLSPDSTQDRLVGAVEYNGKIYFDYGNINTNGRSVVSSAFDSRWNHYIFTISKANNYKRIYKNDTLLINDSLGTSQLSTKGKTLLIGAGTDADNGNIRFHGSISNFEIYNCSLDSSEAAVLYRSSGCQNVLGIAAIDEPSVAISVFPNPTTGSFTLQSNAQITGKLKLNLYNLFGQCLISNETLLEGDNSTKMTFPTCANPGMYILVVSYGNERSVQRIVLER